MFPQAIGALQLWGMKTSRSACALLTKPSADTQLPHCNRQESDISLLTSNIATNCESLPKAQSQSSVAVIQTHQELEPSVLSGATLQQDSHLTLERPFTPPTRSKISGALPHTRSPLKSSKGIVGKNFLDAQTLALPATESKISTPLPFVSQLKCKEEEGDTALMKSPAVEWLRSVKKFEDWLADHKHVGNNGHYTKPMPVVAEQLAAKTLALPGCTEKQSRVFAAQRQKLFWPMEPSMKKCRKFDTCEGTLSQTRAHRIDVAPWAKNEFRDFAGLPQRGKLVRGNLAPVWNQQSKISLNTRFP